MTKLNCVIIDDEPLAIKLIQEYGNKFPQLEFKDDLFVTFHGSWNRSVPTGYKVVRIDTTQTKSKEINFITGWLTNNAVWGRPVDVKFDSKGDMFITDDLANAIYKVEYIGVE